MISQPSPEQSGELLHDLKIINSQVGEYTVSEDYRSLVNIWREQGEQPSPNHPKLVHYNTRRRAHLYKLSLISAIDRSNALLLTRDDFNRAMNWLVEAETYMPDIFKAGASGADSQAMDQIYHFVLMKGKLGASETQIMNEARKLVPAHSVLRMIDVMQRSGMIEAYAIDKKTGLRQFRVIVSLD